MKIYVYLNGEIVGRGKDVKSCLKHVSKLFKQGHTDIQLSGGRIGRWRE